MAHGQDVHGALGRPFRDGLLESRQALGPRQSRRRCRRRTITPVFLLLLTINGTIFRCYCCHCHCFLGLSLDQENSSSVKLPPSYVMSAPDDDVDWEPAATIAGCPEHLWCRVGNTTTPDVPTTPLTTIAYVSSKVPASLAVAAGNQSFVFLGAARSTHVSSDPLADALAAHKAASPSSSSPSPPLLPSHHAAWLDTWSLSIIEYEGDDFVRHAINATLYIILSGHDDTFSTGFPVCI